MESVLYYGVIKNVIKCSFNATNNYYVCSSQSKLNRILAFMLRTV